MAQLKNTTISDTGFLQLPVGTTAQRPTTPANGQMRFNTTAGKAEFYNATAAAWLGTAATGVVATGGTVYDVDVEGTTYRVHTFTTTGNSTFTVTQGGSVEYLIVAGGGAGGAQNAGGGGAGGLVTGSTTVTSQSYTITVGAGAGPGPRFPMGTGGIRYQPFPAGIRGDNSSAFGLVAIGGGNGGGDDSFGCDGGSGGGGADDANFAGPGESVQNSAGAVGFGNRGGDGRLGGNGEAGAGGGGAGEAGYTNASSAGGNQRKGGNGLVSFISGTPTFYAGGGGGSMKTAGSTGSAGAGGLGGGGQGGSPSGFGNSGTPNTGGGGGGNSISTEENNGGGSGIVIVRYPLRQENPVVAAGKTVGDGLVLDLDFAKPTVYAGSGTAVNDSRLNGIRGTVFNSSPSAPRSHRASFTFNGSSSYIDTNNTLIKTTGGWTVSSWVQTGATVNSGGLLHNFIGSSTITYNSWYWTVRDSRLSLWNRDPGLWRDGSTIIQPNTVYQAVLVSNPSGTSYQFYLNGVAEGGNHTTYSWNSSFAGLIIGYVGRGNNANGRYWVGEYYSLQVWDRALTASEIQQNFNATRWRFGV